jgi:hypothetical protein
VYRFFLFFDIHHSKEKIVARRSSGFGGTGAEIRSPTGGWGGGGNCATSSTESATKTAAPHASDAKVPEEVKPGQIGWHDANLNITD